MANNSSLHFDVSTGLKTVLGRELITDDAVAIFEMVKNSFDAGATAVHLHFDDNCIVVADNGSGMSYDDILSKWLFVAYSSKRRNGDVDYRDAIAARTFVAGSKGIGRFSSDRLGTSITLQTQARGEPSAVHKIEVNWDLFEKDDSKHFDDIPVSYSKSDTFVVPKAVDQFSRKLRHGTVIEISGLRHDWGRTELQSLKAALSKLINPFGSDVDKFEITLSAPREKEADDRVKAKAKTEETTPPNREIVNGRVGNFIFSDLQERTTFLTVEIKGSEIFSSLTDRGELVYKVKEPNKYPLLINSGFRAEIYYLNHSAKLTFARRVGLPSVQFGSIFLFRNGFRIFPIGEEHDDWFGYNRRKQQGYNRFLGSREMIGRVDVYGAVGDFEEASSRNQGLIDSPAVRELKACVMDHCVKRLEKYVVPVSWVDKGEANTEDLSRLLTDPGRARVSASVANLVDNDDVQLLDYSKKLVGLLNERSENFEGSLVSLRAIADKTDDQKLLGKIAAAEARFEELRTAEAEARKIADRERAAAAQAVQRAERAEYAAVVAQAEADVERRRAHFLDEVTSIDVKQLLSLQHQVTLYSNEVNQQLENLLVETSGTKNVSRERLVQALDQVIFLNRRIQAVSRFAAVANFELDSGKVNADLASYLYDYIRKVARISGSARTRIEVENSHPGFKLKFNPMDAAIIVDNLVSNAKRQKASRISFDLRSLSKGGLIMSVTDNGPGFARGVDPRRIFDMGYSTTEGSGLGLYHVRQVLGELNGTIELDPDQPDRGVRFLIKIAKLGKS